MQLRVMSKTLIRTFVLPALFTITFVYKRRTRGTDEPNGLRHRRL